MQLQFTRDELKLVAEILEQQSLSTAETMKRTSYSLLDRLIAHDLRFAFDELEDLQDILVTYQKSLRDQILMAAPETKPALLHRAKLLERVVDKVSEACAMV